MRFAQKTSAALINGMWVDVFKDPVTDSGKRSKKGRVTTVEKDGEFKAVTLETIPEGWTDVLSTVYQNGKLLRDVTFNEIRAEASN
jgi:nicotinamide phosphoribosyltransferase